MGIVSLIIVTGIVLAVVQKFLVDPLHAKLDRIIKLLESAEPPST